MQPAFFDMLAEGAIELGRKPLGINRSAKLKMDT
jgi:hypothetical protein